MENDIVKKILVNEFRVISSGQILVNSDKVIVSVCVKEFSFDIEFFFVSESNQGSRLELRKEGESRMILECVNFEDLGTGTTSPIRIAIVDNKDLALSFFASKAAASTRKLEYTFLIGEEDSNGNN